MLTTARLKEKLHYDPATGEFTRLVLVSGPHGQVGAVAGYRDEMGYVRITVDGVCYKAHRLAYLYVNGCWPPADIDHRNLDRADNSWANLRPATRRENTSNRPNFKNNTSGIKGVSFHRRSGKWKAQIQVSGSKIGLGYFTDKEAAGAAYREAALRLHGDFARFN